MTPPRQQHPTREEREAARRYLEHDHAARTLGGDAGAEANRHAQEIDEQHPRVRDIAMTGTPRDLGELPAHLRRHQRRIREEAHITPEHAARIRREYRTPPQPESRRRSSSPPAPPTPRERADQAATATGRAVSTAASAAGDTEWGGLLYQVFMWGVGLSALYLLLTHAKGPAELVKGATNVVRGVVSPVVDPLNPKVGLHV